MIAIAAALAGVATLHVAVHREAGTLADIAADGAAGQCSMVGTARVVCPATGPVRFRWGPGEDWVLHGDLEVLPGQIGTAFVLAPEPSRREERARFAGEVTPEDVREVFLRTGDRAIPPVSAGLFEDLIGLADHEDHRVRREMVRGLMPYARHTASDPFPADAPSLIPAGFLTRVASDRHPAVRRRLANLVRELIPEDQRIDEAGPILRRYLKDSNRGVRRLAVAIATAHAREGGDDEALEAWNAALGRVPREGAPGRAAANGLAKLRVSVEPTRVDSDGALSLIVRHHPERGWRFWTAWRREIPFDPARAEQLFTQTVGLSQPLLRYWAERYPAELAEVLETWEPSEPHSDRWEITRAWIEPVAEHPGLRETLGLSPLEE